MARKIIWSHSALKSKDKILKFWIERNKSDVFSKKLNKLIISNSEFVATYPFTGVKTQLDNVRLKFISHYALIYQITREQIVIHSIFDTRQHPIKLDDIINKI